MINIYMHASDTKKIEFHYRTITSQLHLNQLLIIITYIISQ